MTNISAASLTDAALLDETIRAADTERQSTAELLALLAEVDTRKLYLAQGYPSLFAWCMQVLHLSEPSAYGRITAARAARRFPLILSRLADGSLTLTTVNLLAAHLTDENHEELISAAHQRSKRDVERLVACLDPQPDAGHAHEARAHSGSAASHDSQRRPRGDRRSGADAAARAAREDQVRRDRAAHCPAGRTAECAD